MKTKQDYMAMAQIDAVESLLDQIEAQKRLIAALRVAARYPLSGWQKAEADSEKRRAERLFNENSTLRLEAKRYRILEREIWGQDITEFLSKPGLTRENFGAAVDALSEER